MFALAKSSRRETPFMATLSPAAGKVTRPCAADRVTRSRATKLALHREAAFPGAAKRLVVSTDFALHGRAQPPSDASDGEDRLRPPPRPRNLCRQFRRPRIRVCGGHFAHAFGGQR